VNQCENTAEAGVLRSAEQLGLSRACINTLMIARELRHRRSGGVFSYPREALLEFLVNKNACFHRAGSTGRC